MNNFLIDSFNKILCSGRLIGFINFNLEYMKIVINFLSKRSIRRTTQPSL